jgi:Skp family chaperone for outer membrane proteins
MKSILVFSHDHNSFDKKHLLENPNQFMSISDKKVEDFVKEEDLKKFFMTDIDNLLKMYEPGRPENKPDVLKQLDEIKQQREEMIEEHQRKQQEYQDTINKVNRMYGQNGNQKIIDQMSIIIQEVTMENKLLKDKVKYLEDKMGQIIKEQIEKSKLKKLN